MSPDNSVDSAESIALLSQYEQLPNPTASDSTPVLGRQSGQLSPRLEVILSQCQTENEIDREMWDDFEVHRRFADTYLKQYLDYSELMHAQRSRHVHEINEFDDKNIATDVVARTSDSHASGKTREEWRLKISHDSAVRDLLAMHETLEFLKERSSYSPRRFELPPFAWSLFPISAWSVSASVVSSYLLWQNCHRWEALSVFTTYAVGVTYHYSPQMWRRLRSTSIECCQKKIEKSLQRLRKAEVDDRHRADLERESFWMLELFRK